jgi:hypothetical protein
MHNEVKCKDYFIIKIQYYADKRLLKKWHEGGVMPIQHWERAKEYVDFVWRFVEMATGEGTEYWHTKYMFDAKECAIEEVEEKYGIFYSGGEGWATFMIPLRHTKMIKWMKSNIQLPNKVVSRTNLVGYFSRLHRNCKRDMAHELKKTTRKVITEKVVKKLI